MEGDPHISVMVVDDHQILREGLRHLLERERDIKVVAEAPDGRTAMKLARELNPHIIIMDLSMPDMNGIEATSRILAECPKVKIIGLSMHNDRRFPLKMLKAGACGYLLKHCAFKELVQAIRQVMKGRNYLSNEVMGFLVEDYKNLSQERQPSAFSNITNREREVLQLIAEGKTTSEIAKMLYISAKTVDTHRHQIMQKLGLYSIAELTKFAIQEGLTSAEIPLGFRG